MGDGLNFLEAETREELCDEDELELRYKNDSSNDLKWNDELAEMLGFLEEEQKQKGFTREERIAACGAVGHSMNHLGELVTHVCLKGGAVFARCGSSSRFRRRCIFALLGAKHLKFVSDNLQLRTLISLGTFPGI